MNHKQSLTYFARAPYRGAKSLHSTRQQRESFFKSQNLRAWITYLEFISSLFVPSKNVSLPNPGGAPSAGEKNAHTMAVFCSSSTTRYQKRP
ncbi:hypothetical protein SAMN02745866_03942 [Alteromonadaceae bacterium Bs31]|nr:hypothetical protein SAMN02745866_03942 [Alteromonadaceae bacterium Bs31]